MNDLTKDPAEVDEFIDQFGELQRKRALALRQLLDEQLQRGRILATSSHQGGTDSYISSQTLEWLGDRLSLFTQLPLMRNYYDQQTGKLKIDNESVQFLQQRAPNWSRQVMLTRYLLLNPRRKFPTLLAVVSEPWVDNPTAPQWENGRATVSSIPASPIDSAGNAVFLDLNGKVDIFTVDGQHRLLGIQGLRDLLRTGKLDIRRADGSPVPNKVETLAKVAQDLAMQEGEFQGIKRESMGIEFIPAVMTGETREEAHQRIRSIFVSVNKTAHPVSAGELATLDEDDGFAIIGRKVALSHPLFTRDTEGDRVNWKSTALPAGSKWLTPVATLRDMAEAYLGVVRPYSNWKVKSKEAAIRPDEDDLEQGDDAFKLLIDQVAALPSFTAVQRGEKIDEWREFPSKTRPDARGHLLFRPLGQLIVAMAVGELHMQETGPELPLDLIFTKIKKYDAALGFEGVEKPTSIWYGITFDPFKKKMLMTERNIAVRLLKYLINGADANEQGELAEALRSARLTIDEKGNEAWWKLDGKLTRNRDEVQLPAMI